MSSKIKNTRIELSFVESAVRYSGTTELTICGRTEGGVDHKVVLSLAPYALGHIAEALHKAVEAQQATLDNVKNSLRGDLT